MKIVCVSKHLNPERYLRSIKFRLGESVFLPSLPGCDQFWLDVIRGQKNIDKFTTPHIAYINVSKQTELSLLRNERLNNKLVKNISYCILFEISPSQYYFVMTFLIKMFIQVKIPPINFKFKSWLKNKLLILKNILLIEISLVFLFFIAFDIGVVKLSCKLDTLEYIFE